MRRLVIRIPTLLCERCCHTWEPRHEHVQMCPKCKSRLWNVPRKTPKWGTFKDAAARRARLARIKKGGA